MRTRLIILFSLLNIAVVGVGFYLLSQYLADRLANERQSVVVKNLGTLMSKSAKQTASPTLAKPAAPTVIYQTNKFHWSQIETNDYRAYITNLRGVGCPEATIRDIILTDIMKLYAARRGQFYVNGREFKFWETDDKRKLKQAQLEQREAQLAAIDKEIPGVLRDLLGINYERELNKYFVDTNEDDRRLSFLSEDKRAQVLALRDQFEGLRENVLDKAVNGQLSAGQLDRLNKIQQQREDALAKILSPEEIEQYELSTSETADRLRRELIGFNPNETEFREIFRRQKALDAKYAYEDLSDETVRTARAADDEKFEQEIKTLLGDARAAEYNRAKNSDYRALCVLSEQFEWPASTVQTLTEIRQIAENERQNLLGNTGIAAEKRNEALRAIQSETERNLRQTLGEKAFSAYSQAAGAWIQNLGTN